MSRMCIYPCEHCGEKAPEEDASIPMKSKTKNFGAGIEAGTLFLKAKPTKDSMIKQINLLLEALSESEVKEIYEHLTSVDIRGLKLYVVVRHECK